MEPPTEMYAELCSFENLFLAYRKARKGKRGTWSSSPGPGTAKISRFRVECSLTMQNSPQSFRPNLAIALVGFAVLFGLALAGVRALQPTDSRQSQPAEPVQEQESAGAAVGLLPALPTSGPVLTPTPDPPHALPRVRTQVGTVHRASRRYPGKHCPALHGQHPANPASQRLERPELCGSRAGAEHPAARPGEQRTWLQDHPRFRAGVQPLECRL